MNFLKTCLVGIFIIVGIPAFSQAKDSVYVGTVKGITRDSVNNYVLQSATVSLYRLKDSSLLGYQLSKNSGEFKFEKMPVGMPLQVVVSFSGYKNFKKEFTIPRDKKEVDLKDLNVATKDMLEEVVVEYIPPMRVKGDTVEFNADAFKLGKNDVAEDLFRKLPGVTVWGDGAIFVDGKEVNNLLVDGKPFLGGDSKVAIQNLPKDAIDKVQVYQQILDEQNPLDSTTEINIRMKADKKSGKFGKIGIGYGSRDRFDAGGGMNFYSPGQQLTLVGAANNVNKGADNVHSLMRQGTFKNRGVDVEYQPNFRAQGLSRPLSAGFNYQRNFVETPRWRKQNQLSANYFIQNNERENLRETKTETTFTGDSSRIQNSSSENVTVNTNQAMDLRYKKENDRFYLNIAPALRWNTSNNSNVQESSSYGSKQGLQSTNHIENAGTDDSKNLNMKIDFNSYQNPLQITRIPTDFQSNYSLSMNENNNERFNKTTFISLIDPGQNKNFDRQYNNRSKNLNQSLNFSSGDLRRLFFGYGDFGGINIRLQNNLNVNTQENSRIVADKDTTAKTYVINKSLSNETGLNTINERPGFRFSKDFKKYLANRYFKNVRVNLNMQWQFYNQKHSSDFAFQNITRDYRKFTPEASISYQNKQFGEYETSFNLAYRATSEYPSINQLAPLVDSSNLYNIRLGNLNLQPMDRRNFSFSIDHSSKKREAMFGYKVNISAGYINNNIIDSSIIDGSGRTTHYSVNADGSKYANLDGNLNKAFRFSENQIQVNVNTRFGFSKNPAYLNSVMNFSDNFTNSNGLNVYYTLKDILAFNLGQNLSFSRSIQSGFNNREFGTNTKTTTASGSYNLTRKLSLSSNISYNSTTATGSESIDFTIWNANINYRFLKGNNAEIKFSGLDLLHQNISIINTVHNNTLTTGVANVLQNFYMITLSYYPRSFGRGGRRGR